MTKKDMMSVVRISARITLVTSVGSILLFSIYLEMNRIVAGSARLTDLLFVPLVVFVIFMLAGIAVILEE